MDIEHEAGSGTETKPKPGSGMETEDDGAMDVETPPGSPGPGEDPRPSDWTKDKTNMNYSYYWGSSESDGQVMAKTLGLMSPQPIIASSRESDDCLSIFQSGNKYYLWNMIEGAVFEIVKPTGWEEIEAAIMKLGVHSLAMTRVYAKDSN